MNKDCRLLTEIFIEIMIFLAAAKTLTDEIIGAISVYLYPVLVLPILAILVVVLLVLLVVIFKRNRKRGIVLLLSLGILLLPLCGMYEAARFYILRKEMERVAVTIAQDYQYKTVKDSNIYNVELKEDEKYLSRGKTVNIYLSPENIRIAFYKKNGYFNHSETYTFDTQVPFLGEVN